CADSPHMREHPLQLRPHFLKVLLNFIRLYGNQVIDTERGDPPERNVIGHQVLSAALYTDHHPQRYHMIIRDPPGMAVHVLQDSAPLLSHGCKYFAEDLAVHRAGDIVMLKRQMVLVLIQLVKQEGPYDAAGSFLREKVQCILI